MYFLNKIFIIFLKLFSTCLEQQETNIIQYCTDVLQLNKIGLLLVIWVIKLNNGYVIVYNNYIIIPLMFSENTQVNKVIQNCTDVLQLNKIGLLMVITY